MRLCDCSAEHAVVKYNATAVKCASGYGIGIICTQNEQNFIKIAPVYVDL